MHTVYDTSHDTILNYIKDNIVVEARLQERTLNNSASATFPLNRPLPPIHSQANTKLGSPTIPLKRKKKINKPKNIPFSRAPTPPHTILHARRDTLNPFLPSNSHQSSPTISPYPKKNKKKKGKRTIVTLHYGGFPFNHLASCLHIYETPPSPSLPSSHPLPSAPLKSKGWRESVAQFRPTFFLKTSPPRATRFPRCERTRPSPSPPRLARAPTFALDRPPPRLPRLPPRVGSRRWYVRTRRGMRTVRALRLTDATAEGLISESVNSIRDY